MEPDLAHRIGRRLKELREQCGLTQAQLAELSLKSVETISNIERGKTIPSLMTLANMAGHLRTDLNGFFAEGQAAGPSDALSSPIDGKAQLLNPAERQLVADFVDLIIRHRSNLR